MQHAVFFVAALLGGASLAAAQVDADGALAAPPVSQALILDDLQQVTPAWKAAMVMDSVRGLPDQGGMPEAGWDTTPRTFDGPKIAKNDANAEAPISRYSVEGLLKRPLYNESEGSGGEGEKRITARVRHMKASFGPDGMTAYPVLGKKATELFAVRFDLDVVTVGGRHFAFDRAAQISRRDDDIILDRSSIHEVYHITLEGVEQTFVFEVLPDPGDLVLEIDVVSNLGVQQDESGIHFMHETLGGVTYGDAFVVDANGCRQSIQRNWTGDSIELTVPAAFLADATYPITVDPPVTSFTSTAGVPDDSVADLCYAGVEGVYWAVWEDYVTGTYRDTYAASFDTAGAVVDFIAVDTSPNDWSAPKIAYHYGSNRCLVSSSEIDSNGFGSIQGTIIDCATATIAVGPFDISSVGALKVHSDVGGNNWDSTINSHFLVAWSSVWSPGSMHQVQYRVVNWDGTMITGLESVTPLAEVHNQPALSETHGDGDLFGDLWTLVWTADTDNDGFGPIMARRVVWSGNSSFGAGNFVVAPQSNCSHPRVTSRFNLDLQHIADRPSLVVYERDFASPGGPSGRQRSLYAKVVTDGVAEVESPISWQLEDFDLDLDQREPAIACDGNCFYLVYAEIFYGEPAGSDYDMYMLSGCITDSLDGAEISLAERHEDLALSSSAERGGAVATTWDGDPGAFSDQGMAIWEDRNVTNGGTLEGATLEMLTNSQSPIRAVGRQFCDANPNSGGGQQGRQASWSWLEGDQSLATTHVYHGTDLPLYSFGYAVIGTFFANINHPAGSLGRVCVPGGGRYVDQVEYSGSTGTFTTLIDPMSVPTPTGFISMQVGETWGFQYWHRDIAPDGTVSSNFSTACKMQFTN